MRKLHKADWIWPYTWWSRIVSLESQNKALRDTVMNLHAEHTKAMQWHTERLVYQQQIAELQERVAKSTPDG